MSGTAPSTAVQAKDELNNRRLCGGDTFDIRLEGPASVDGSVEDHGDGTYTASYRACRAGPYTLSVTNGATPFLQTISSLPGTHRRQLQSITPADLDLSACLDADHLRLDSLKKQQKQQTEAKVGTQQASCAGPSQQFCSGLQTWKSMWRARHMIS